MQILGPNYMEALLKWVDIESLPTFMGGKSEGTLYDDVGPWNNPALMAEMGIDVDALRRGRPRPPGAPAIIPGSFAHASFQRMSSGDGAGNLAFMTPMGSMVHSMGSMPRPASLRCGGDLGPGQAQSWNAVCVRVSCCVSCAVAYHWGLGGAWHPCQARARQRGESRAGLGSWARLQGLPCRPARPSGDNQAPVAATHVAHPQTRARMHTARPLCQWPPLRCA